MKIAVLGAGGMAGHIIYQHLLESDYNCVPYYHKDKENGLKFNAEDEQQIYDLVHKNNYAYIINCTGVLIKESEEDPEKAIRVNALFPKILERHASETDIKIIHISTDCVFSGANGSYQEDSPKDGLDTYAKTKALGEINNSKDLTIRTSIIGPELKHNGSGLFNWFMNQKDKANGYADHFWSGVTTLELAKAIEYIIHNPISGLIHLTNNSKISKYNLLQLINEYRFDNKIQIDKYYTGSIIDKSLINTRNEFKYKVPRYEKMIKELFEYIAKHKNIYQAKYTI